MRNVLIATKFINDVFDKYDCIIHTIIDNKVWDKNNRHRIEFLQELVESEKFSVHLSDKMKKNISHRKKLGHHIGPVKFGYERVKVNNIMKLKKNQKEQYILGVIKKELKNNNKDYKNICNKLNLNRCSKRGKSWDVNMIKYIEKNNLDKVKPCDMILSEDENNMDVDEESVSSYMDVDNTTDNLENLIL